MHRRQYEFSAAENHTLASVAGHARHLGVVHLIWAGLSFFTANVVGAGLWAVSGALLHSGASRMQRVVDTHGQDLDHLMTALDHLVGVFTFRLVLLVIGLVLFALALTALIVLVFAVDANLLF